MLLIHEDESVYQGPEGEKLMGDTLAKHMALAEQFQAAGVEFSGNRLQGAENATTIRWRDGEHSLHDGPFAETHEELGGYYLIEAADLDAALEWAKKIPIAGTGSIEVRPVWAP